MSVNKGQIRVASERKGDVFVFHAKLTLDNDNTIPLRTLNEVPKDQRNQFVYDVEHTLAMSIIAHIYGDLIDPVNKLATIAEANAIVPEDFKQIKEIRQVIADILLGKIPEQDAEGVIITGN